jgi:hypothetical protein
VPVHRQEVYDEIQRNNREALTRGRSLVPRLTTTKYAVPAVPPPPPVMVVPPPVAPVPAPPPPAAQPPVPAAAPPPEAVKPAPKRRVRSAKA